MISDLFIASYHFDPIWSFWSFRIIFVILLKLILIVFVTGVVLIIFGHFDHIGSFSDILIISHNFDHFWVLRSFRILILQSLWIIFIVIGVIVSMRSFWWFWSLCLALVEWLFQSCLNVTSASVTFSLPTCRWPTRIWEKSIIYPCLPCFDKFVHIRDKYFSLNSWLW